MLEVVKVLVLQQAGSDVALGRERSKDGHIVSRWVQVQVSVAASIKNPISMWHARPSVGLNNNTREERDKNKRHSRAWQVQMDQG
jgi:hypothetical protein